jgi:hypothetical protein
MSCFRRLKLVLVATLLATASLAKDAVGSTTADPTGLWYDPAESGWGLSIAKQGDVAFAVLFVYDPAKQPTWYVASSMHVGVQFAPTPGASATFYQGTLYRTSGPWFGGTFDPATVTMTDVGRMELDTNADGTLQLAYVIDGTVHVKTVRRTTWDSNLALLTGGKPVGESVTYAGAPTITSMSPDTCPVLNLGGPADAMPTRFSVSASPFGSNRAFVGWGTGIDTACIIEGAYTQSGQLGSISGHLRCGPIGTGTPSATDPQVDITDIVASEHGFAGGFTYQANGCTYTGHIGGARLSD